LTVYRPRVVEVRRLHQLLEGELRAWQRRRAETILLSAAGLNAADIAAVLKVHVHIKAHVHIVSADLHAFEQDGLASVHRRRCLGRPAAADGRAAGRDLSAGGGTAL
jgi:hypothetical protein